MTSPHLHTVGLVVRDMAATLSFYGTLGLDIPASMDSEEHVDVTLQNGVALEFDRESPVRQFDPGWVVPTGQRLNLQFSVATPADVDETPLRPCQTAASSLRTGRPSLRDHREIVERGIPTAERGRNRRHDAWPGAVRRRVPRGRSTNSGGRGITHRASD